MIRKSTAVWRGDLKTGTGALSGPSGAFKDLPYSFKDRFQNESGKAGTNPEELLGAAHAGCFAMQFASVLSGAGHAPAELNVEAAVTIDKVGEGFSITAIALTVGAKVTGIDAAKLQSLAETAKKDCPVSKALSATPVSMSVKLL